MINLPVGTVGAATPCSDAAIGPAAEFLAIPSHLLHLCCTEEKNQLRSKDLNLD